MFSIKKVVLIIPVIMLCAAQTMHGMNLLHPYDTLIRPAYSNKYPFQISLFAQAGVSNKGYNSDGNSTNALRIWQCDQNALAMLDGFADDTAIGRKRLEIDADDDGVRGHFCVDGDLKTKFSGAIGFRSFFKKNWSISAYLPFYSMELSNVCWRDQTKQVSDEDDRVRSFLTNDFASQVYTLGDGLDIGGWKRTGPGDLTILGEWFHDFAQPKPLLKNVRVNLRGGFSFPTGLRQDVDKIMAVPFGNDGAFALPFGVGLDLHFKFYLRAGFDVQLTHVFGHTRERRIMTDQNQTDLLLLEKMNVYKDPGMTQQFNLYAQLYELIKGTAFLIGYQFVKHGEDDISLCANDSFSTSIANDAIHLQERMIHQCIIRADYGIGSLFNDDSRVYPRISIYARIPFAGTRVAVSTGLGLTMGIDF